MVRKLHTLLLFKHDLKRCLFQLILRQGLMLLAQDQPLQPGAVQQRGEISNRVILQNHFRQNRQIRQER